MMDLDEPAAIDEDELADEDVVLDDAGGTDANGRPESAVISGVRHLGPCTAREVADLISRDIGNVSTRLRQLEQAGKVRRTGKTVNPVGARGGPQVEWELMPANGTRTDPTQPLISAGPVEDRLRKLAERLGHANGRVETLENELGAAKTRADQSDERARESERRRQMAETRAQHGSVDPMGPEMLQARRRAEEAERSCAELQQQLAAAGERINALSERAPASAPVSEGGHRGGRDARAVLRSAAREGAHGRRGRVRVRPDRADARTDRWERVNGT